MNKLEVQDLSESSHDHKFTSVKDDEGREIENTSRREQSTSVALLSVQQLQDMITNTIRAQQEVLLQVLSHIQNPTQSALTT